MISAISLLLLLPSLHWQVVRYRWIFFATIFQRVWPSPSPSTMRAWTLFSFSCCQYSSFFGTQQSHSNINQSWQQIIRLVVLAPRWHPLPLLESMTSRMMTASNKMVLTTTTTTPLLPPHHHHHHHWAISRHAWLPSTLFCPHQEDQKQIM